MRMGGALQAPLASMPAGNSILIRVGSDIPTGPSIA